MEFANRLEVCTDEDIIMFEDLRDLCCYDDIDLLCKGIKVRFTVLEGFFHNDGVRFFMLLLNELWGNPNGEAYVCGCICTRESWPGCRMPDTDEEWALMEEHFRLFQEEIQKSLEHLDTDEEADDVPY